MRNHDRTDLRGVTLDVVDLAPVEAEATEWAHAHDDDRINDYDRLEVGWKPWALLTDSTGNHWLVCNEGVAYRLDDDCEQQCAESTLAREPHVHLDLYGRGTRSSDTESITMMPVASSTLTLDRARELRTGETVDLTDHVRVFGARLEDNVRSLYALATRPESARARA